MELDRVSPPSSPEMNDNRLRFSISSTESIRGREDAALPVIETEEDEKLPPIDGGLAAWSIIFGGWFAEGLLWGYPLSYGIFQSYYFHNPPFEGNRALPIVGNLATGVSSLMLPFVTPIVLKNPDHQLHIMWFGWTLCILGLLGASIATHVWHLMLFQGVLYGLGWVLCYTPMLIITNGWFVKRRGLVYGILFGASGVTNIFLPFGLEALLQKYDFRATLRYMALGVVLISGPPFYFVRPRTRSASKSPAPALDYSFLKQKRFYGFAFSVAFQGIGFFLPHIFLPSFAHNLSMSQNQGAALVALYSLFQVSGQMTIGHFSDKVDVHIPLAMSPLISGLSAILLWGPAKSFLPLALFPIVYGFFGASYTVMWSRVSMYLTEDPGTATTIFGMFSLERGSLNVLAGPISAWLLGEELVIEQYGLGKYKNIVLFVGCSMLISSTIGFGYFWRKRDEGPKVHIQDDQNCSYELLSKVPQTIDPIRSIQPSNSTLQADEFKIEDSDEDERSP